MTALDQQERAIPGVFATRHSVWAADLHDFREKGLDFDTGFGADKVNLDESNADGKHGLIAFARGHNDYLAGHFVRRSRRCKSSGSDAWRK